MKKIIILILIFSSCEKDIHELIIIEPPVLSLIEFEKDYERSTLLTYSLECTDCRFQVEGQTMSYLITSDGKTVSQRSFDNRGVFGCSVNCASSFSIVFSNGFFDLGIPYEIIVSYTMPETECFSEGISSNRFEFVY